MLNNLLLNPSHLRNYLLYPEEHEMNLWEYMLLANSDEAVLQKIIAEKKYFEDRYETGISVKTLPHIIIASFLAKEIIEDRICRLLQNVCNQNYSFTTALNNFSGLPPHAVFLRVQNIQPFKQLHNGLQALDNLLITNGCPPLKIVDNPHLSLARRLPQEIYNEAIKEYAQRDFHELFTVEKLALLKRENDYENWQHVNYFYLPQERNSFN